MRARWVFLLTVSLASAVQAAETLPTAPTLRQLAQKSAYIFAGTVIEVEKIQPGGPYGVATMQVTVRVDNAIRGVRPRQVIAIREWIGLWNNGCRYREGERVLLRSLGGGIEKAGSRHEARISGYHALRKQNDTGDENSDRLHGSFSSARFTARRKS